MSTVLGERSAAPAGRGGWRPWVALALGFALLYVPTYIDLARGLWRDDAYAHGPIILAVFAFLLWQARAVLLDDALKPAPLAGGAMLAFGLALYLLGRTQALALFEVASHLPVIAGAVLLVRGYQGLRKLAFPILFLLFLVPLPGFLLEALTGPLKQFVSVAVAGLLQMFGYAVERNGVVLAIGDHEMLVADACSGLNSLYSLMAMGLLYVHLTQPRRLARTALIMAAVVPIAVAANVLRVLALVLVTVHLGDGAQKFVHDFAGHIAFAAGFLMLVGVDKLVVALLGRKQGVEPQRGADGPVAEPVFSGGRPTHAAFGFALVAGIAMAFAAAAAPVLKPVPDRSADLDLERLIPASFGDWRIDPDEEPVSASPDVEANLARLYQQIVARTYVNSRGERMMLTVAHGGDQSDALKAHRQEVCYRAQGFEIRALAHGSYSTAGRTIPVTRMLAVRGERSEPVTYWFTMGDRVVLGRLERLQVQLANGLAGRIPDGMLVRVSSLSENAPQAFAAQEAFMAAIIAAVPATQVARLVGAPQG